jgi:hypothetical protein
MGTLHEVYQVKPKVINSGAILPVRKDKEHLFHEKYIGSRTDCSDGYGIFSNTFVTKSDNGKIMRCAIYANERIIDFGTPGLFVAIQDGSKYGFGSDFNEFLSNLSPYLEDALFYIIWDNLISRYEITEGKLYFRTSNDFDLWNYIFEEYLIAEYTDNPQIIADFHVDITHEMIARHNERIKFGEDPREFYDPEEYEDLLHKINNYKKEISTEEFKKLEGWLKHQIDSY